MTEKRFTYNVYDGFKDKNKHLSCYQVANLLNQFTKRLEEKEELLNKQLKVNNNLTKRIKELEK